MTLTVVFWISVSFLFFPLGSSILLLVPPCIEREHDDLGFFPEVSVHVLHRYHELNDPEKFSLLLFCNFFKFKVKWKVRQSVRYWQNFCIHIFVTKSKAERKIPYLTCCCIWVIPRENLGYNFTFDILLGKRMRDLHKIELSCINS